MKNVVSEGKEKAQLVYEWAEQKSYLSPFVKEPRFRSNVVCTIDVDEKLPVDSLLKKLHEEGVVYGIEAYRKLGRNQFRIGVFHNVLKQDVEKLIELLTYYLEH